MRQAEVSHVSHSFDSTVWQTDNHAMTIEELADKVVGVMAHRGWESIRTTEGDSGTTLTVVFNADTPASISFETPGWINSGIHDAPASSMRRWKIDFRKTTFRRIG